METVIGFVVIGFIVLSIGLTLAQLIASMIGKNGWYDAIERWRK